jgi:hypothetical protein
MAITKKWEARKSLHQPRLDHPRRRLRGASVRGAGYVQHGCEDRDGRHQRAARPVAAGVRARRQDGAKLRSGVASRKVCRRQVRPVA